MHKYLIERNIPGAQTMTKQDRREASTRSCDVLDQLGPGIEWEQSYISRDRVTCIYNAENEDIIREHARLSGFPATRITRIEAGLSPDLAESGSAAAAK